MNSKKWCIVAVVAVIAAVILIAAVNVVVDPFGVFGEKWYSYNETNNPRVAKIEYLKENFDKYDSYVVGCSSTSSYPVEELNRYMNAEFYNLIMYGADMDDVEKTVYYIAEHDDVKNIVLNVYIANGFDYNFEPDKLTGSMHAEVSGESKTGFYMKYAFANLQYSKAKVTAKMKDRYLSEPFDVFDVETGAYDKRKRDAEPISDMERYYEAYPVFAAYPHGDYSLEAIEENAESIGRIKEFCDKSGINLIVVNAPIYYEYFNDIPKEEIELFYKSIAEKVNFWDFSVSSVSLEPRYFYDSTHFRNDIGKMALARIFDEDSRYIPEDFGVYVTKENVEEYVENFYGKSFDDSDYTKKLPVILYHHISENVTNDMIVSPEKFEEDMKAISDAGFVAVKIEDVINYIEKGEDLPEKPIMITFDDGYMSNYDLAYPILKKYNLHATIFAVGETYGEKTYPGTDVEIFPHFGDEERKEMEESGVIEVQSHTYAMHQNKDLEEGVAYENVLQTDGEKDDEYVKRIKEDYKKWCDTFGETPEALAYPHGISDLFSQELLNECGIKLTFSTIPKTHTLIKGLSQSGYAIGRYTITESMSAEEIISLLNN